jgi:hypothetical protein
MKIQYNEEKSRGKKNEKTKVDQGQERGKKKAETDSLHGSQIHGVKKICNSLFLSSFLFSF